ncbi:uncharacterized protein GGS22DRAFT_70547 [Annulohypoxylon maeteangense]|uniref:uncharacterized protein n=1 Tax=Annulohypoxylon maeteangense TaxID=1927788 RepID=UPI0020072A9B|nr:uncharacterized protein GGS22DRAFT_70547 [Annulohypoxylon maeteangense]KAI0889389.1 hypothetical protein GGS22DRAFT_70547 [Annulohypoxylon maeteangense]
MLFNGGEDWITTLVGARDAIEPRSSVVGGLGPVVIAFAWILAAISVSIFAVRFYVRLTFRGKLSLDDYIIIITLIFIVLNSVFLTFASSWGLGRHIQDLRDDEKRNYDKWVFFCYCPAIMSPGFGRISFAFLLLNLTPPSKARRRLLWVVICAQFIADVGTVIIIYAQCKPVQGFWDKRIEAKCWPAYTQVYAGYLQGSICALSDLVLAVFPCSLFWNLKMHWKQKAFLTAIMGLGIFAMVAAIAKTVYLKEIDGILDRSYNMAILTIWWTIEGNVVLIAVSIPTIKPILNTPRTTKQSQSDRAYHLNTFLSRKRAQENMSGESHGRFTSLQEPSLATGIGGDDSQLELPRNTHQPGVLGESGNRESSVGIRKDITVSITYQESQQSHIQSHLDQSEVREVANETPPIEADSKYYA